MNAMNAKKAPKLAIAMNYIRDDLISGAIDYKPAPSKKIPHIWKHFAAVAACLCLVVSTVWFTQHQYSDEGRNNPLVGTEAKYKVATMDVGTVTEPIQLFSYSVLPPEEICDIVSQRYSNVDCSNAVYVFSYSEGVEDNYWFPVIEDGKIVDIVFATFNSKGNVITGHSESHVDELNTVAGLTSEDTPVYVITEEYFNYYIVGDTAYVANDISGIENEYIGEFIVPEKEIVVVEIP